MTTRPDTPDEATLLPCPFCASPAEHDSQRYQPPTRPEYHGLTGHAITCSKCEAEIGLFDCFEDARVAWNRRGALTPTPLQAAEPVEAGDFERARAYLNSIEGHSNPEDHAAQWFAEARRAGESAGWDEAFAAFSAYLAADVIDAYEGRDTSDQRAAAIVPELAAALREHALTRIEVMRYGGIFERVGTGCLICDSEWKNGQPETHTPACILGRAPLRPAGGEG